MKILDEAKVIEYIKNDLRSGSPIYSDEMYPYYDIDSFQEKLCKSIFTIEFLEKYERVTKEFWEIQELLKDALNEYREIEERLESQGDDN